MLIAITVLQVVLLALVAHLVMRLRPPAGAAPNAPEAGQELGALAEGVAALRSEVGQLAETVRVRPPVTELEAGNAGQELKQELKQLAEAHRESLGAAQGLRQAESSEAAARAQAIREAVEAARRELEAKADAAIEEMGRVMASVTSVQREVEALAEGVSTLGPRFDKVEAEVSAGEERVTEAVLRGVRGEARGLQGELASLRNEVGDVQSQVHAYLGPEREREAIEAGLKMVEEERDRSGEGEAVEMAEALCSRYPHSREAFDALVGLYLPATEEGNDLLVRREAVLRLKEHADRFAEACALDDLARAREVRADVDALADDLMDAVRRQRRDRLAAQVEELATKVGGLGGDGAPADDVLEEIGRLDNGIDKALLGQHEDLRTRYEELSKRLVEGLQEQSDDVRNYNLKALEAAKAAWAMFEKGKGVIKDDFNVTAIAKRLSGWDQRHLLPATSTYISTVYAEVFQKLKPKQRLDMTRRMIKAEDRPLKG